MYTECVNFQSQKSDGAVVSLRILARISNHELMKPGGKKTCVEAAIRSSAALPDHELL